MGFPKAYFCSKRPLTEVVVIPNVDQPLKRQHYISMVGWWYHDITIIISASV